MDTTVVNKTPEVKKGHPRALYILFFTEMWERFGYYLMIGIFFLYLVDPTGDGGKGFNNIQASDLVGSFIALVYLTPFIGGMIADRYLGYRRSILIGGSMMAAGYLGLSLPGNTAMYVSLLCIIVGNGFFKPNISTLLGNIYNESQLKPLKDAAYGIFYMGINIGAFFCNFVAAYLRNYYGWGYAFAAAGIGMVVGLIIFSSNFKDHHIKGSDVLKPLQKEDMPMGRILSNVFLPMVIAGIIGWFFSSMTGSPLFGTKSNDAFLFACVPVIVFYIRLYMQSSKEDKRGLGALLAFFAVSIVFWVIYNQNSTGLTIWAETYTDRGVGDAFPKWMAQPVSSDTVDITKIDPYFRAEMDAEGKTIQTRGTDPYLQNLPKDQWPAPGEKSYLISTEIFQSVNPFFIVVFTILIAIWLFGWMRKRGKEPSTPMKVAQGMFIAGFSSLLMMFAVWSTNIYEDKTSMWWLIGTYAVFTIGELLISPIGLSLVSKLSPTRITAFMMGGWFLVNSIAGKVAGLMATFWDSFTNKSNYFLILFVAAMISGVVMLMLVKWIRGVIREKMGTD